MEVVDEDDDLPNSTYVPPPTISSHSPQLALHTPTSSQHHVVAASSHPATRPTFSSSFAAVDQPMEPLLPANSNTSTTSNPFGFLTAAPRRIRGFGQQLVVERNDSPPPSDAASNRSAQSSNGAFFRTCQEATRSNGARTPDLNFAEIGHGRGSGYPPAGPIPGPSGLSQSRSPMEAMAPQHNLSISNVGHQPDNRTGLGFDAISNLSGRSLSSQWSFLHREAQSPTPGPTPMATDVRRSSQAPAENREAEGRGRSVKRGLRSTFAFATSTFSFGRGSEGPFSFGNKGGK
jgi:F-box and leucine-rich repeat protein GRR1